MSVYRSFKRMMRRCRLVALLALVWLFSHAASAEGPADAQLQGLAQAWLNNAVAESQAGAATALRTEVSVGTVDSRLKLAPCTRVEAYLPAGSRLWGKTRVGLRCGDASARWNISLPATVKAFGTAWVVKGHVLSGAVLTESDAMESEVDWAEDMNPVLQERGQWKGQVATRLLSTGQTLRQGMVKQAQLFQAGTQIRVLAQGAGFEISSDAWALSAGVQGQIARVRMENGRVASGVVLDARTVKIDL